uniref:CUT domain-containing protein n=1 Tax=Caenorhabditis tropicalis TaxID=1561998 RepID=A0A1I7T194_9PELO
MNSNEQSKYLYQQYDDALGEQLKPNTSQYVLADLNKNSSKDKALTVQKNDSEYVLRDLRNQADQNQSFCRDAPNRPFLTGTPVNAKEIRSQIESLDNAIVIPQIIDGKVYFTTHGDGDARTAVEGSTSNPNLNEGKTEKTLKQEGIDLSKMKFTFPQLVRLLGTSTCQRLEREFVKNNRLSEFEMNQLRTARESISELALVTGRSSETTRTAQSVEPNLLSTRTANSVEPNLLSVYSARSPGVFTRNDGILTAQSVEPNLLSVRTANSLEPNLLSVRSAKDLTTMSQLEAQSPGLLTAQIREPNLLSVRTALSSSATSVCDGESRDVMTALEIQSPTTGVLTARSIASGSTQSVLTANEIDSVRSSKDVATAIEILSDLRFEDFTLLFLSKLIDFSRSSQDVRTALEIPESVIPFLL